MVVQDESKTPGYIFLMGVSKHEALGLCWHVEVMVMKWMFEVGGLGFRRF